KVLISSVPTRTNTKKTMIPQKSLRAERRLIGKLSMHILLYTTWVKLPHKELMVFSFKNTDQSYTIDGDYDTFKKFRRWIYSTSPWCASSSWPQAATFACTKNRTEKSAT